MSLSKIYRCYLFSHKAAITLLCALLQLVSQAQAQSPAYLKIGDQDLRNKHVYSILQLPAGQVYVSTNRGLYIGRNKRFEKVERHPQQRGTSLFDLKLDERQNIYCSNLGGQVFQVKDNQLQLFYEHPKEHLGKNFTYSFDKQNNLVVCSKNEVVYNANDSATNFAFPGKSILKISKHKGSIVFHTAIQDTLYFLDNVRLEKKALPKPLEKPHTYWDYFQLQDKKFLSNSDGEFHNLGNSPLFFDVEAVQREAYKTLNDSQILARGIDAGFRLLTLRGDSLKSISYFLEETFISAAIPTKNNGLLLGTFGDGLLWIPHLETKKFSLQAEKNITSIDATENGSVFYSTRGGKLFHFKNGKTELLHHQPGSSLPTVFALEENQTNIHSKFPQLLYNVPGSKKPYGTLKDVCEVEPNYVLIASSRGIFLMGKPKNQLLWEKTNFDEIFKLRGLNTRCQAVTYLNGEEQILYSSSNGTFILGKNAQSKALQFEAKPITANSLVTDKGRVFIATPTDGILEYHNGEIQPLKLKRALKSDYIIQLKLAANELYVHHDQGMQVANLETKTVRDISFLEGIGNNTIQDFDVAGKYLWLLSEKDLMRLPKKPDKKVDVQQIQFSIDSVTVNGGKVGAQLAKELSHEQNKFNFHVQLSSFLLHDEVELLYRVKGLEDDWESVFPLPEKISYKSIPPGKYTFEAKIRFRGETSDVQTFSFQIDRPYWNKWWFYLLVAGAFSMLILLAALYQLRKIRKEAQRKARQQAMEKQMVESELKALRAQMNPHFIFNSLSSIQNLILEQATEKSYDYITVFSKLVRSSLKYSGQEFIAIKDEIEFLNIYLKLENLRFDEELDFSVDYTGNSGIKIPTMIVQPFVENAIVHGLLKKKGKKELKVQFSISGEQIICEVRDNGIGRQKANEVKKQRKSGHESFSTAAIEKRLDYLSKKLKKEAHFEFEDLHNEKGSASGTLVKIFMPYINA